MKEQIKVLPSSDGRQFDFVVDGEMNGATVSTHKCVLFDEPDERGMTNMALIDVLDDGSLSDSVRSGYGQTDIILGTVANCVFAFLKSHPDETVSFRGSDPEGRTVDDDEAISLRQILYNRTLSKKENYKLASNHFIVYGVYRRKNNDSTYEEYVDLYKPNSRARVFLIKLKK